MKSTYKQLEIKVGSKVMCPVTNDDNEESYEVGVLTATNSRFATVKLADRTVKVGKSKIEPILRQPIDVPDTPRRMRIDHKKHSYEKCTSASGNSSLDNADRVALDLRGMELREVYKTVGKVIDISAEELKLKYNHLNPGQQRMCLGNKMRGFLKKLA